MVAIRQTGQGQHYGKLSKRKNFVLKHYDIANASIMQPQIFIEVQYRCLYIKISYSIPCDGKN